MFEKKERSDETERVLWIQQPLIDPVWIQISRQQSIRSLRHAKTSFGHCYLVAAARKSVSSNEKFFVAGNREDVLDKTKNCTACIKAVRKLNILIA